MKDRELRVCWRYQYCALNAKSAAEPRQFCDRWEWSGRDSNPRPPWLQIYGFREVWGAGNVAFPEFLQEYLGLARTNAGLSRTLPLAKRSVTDRLRISGDELARAGRQSGLLTHALIFLPP